MSCEVSSSLEQQTYFELLSDFLPDGLLELLQPIGQVGLELIVMQIFVTELVQNGIFDVLVL